RALRLSHESGWRYNALQKLRSLALLETPQRNLTELRGEAIACVGEFDALEVMRFVGHTNTIWSLDFSPDGTRLATADYDGRVQVWDVAEGRHMREVAHPAVTATFPAVRF